MSQNRSRNRQAAYEKDKKDRRTEDIYNYGNTALQPKVRPRPREKKLQVAETTVRKNRARAHHMSFGYVTFLAVALCMAAFVLVNYVQLQAELTNRIKSVASKESRLNTMKSSNDEEYNRIITGIDLEEIKRIAIGELGMTYAQEGQIILYNDVDNDYMRKVEENDQ